MPFSSFLRWLDNKRESIAPELKTISLSPDHVITAGQPAGAAQALEAGKHYFRLWLSRMALRRDREWFTQWHPAVHSAINLAYGDQQQSLTHVASAAQLPNLEHSPEAILVKDFRLTPQLPFRGGALELSAGLLALKGENEVARLLNVFGDLSKLMMVPQVTSVLAIAGPVAEGAMALFKANTDRLELAYRQSFTADAGANQLRSGYFLVVRSGQAKLDGSSFWLVEGELRYGPTAQSPVFNGYSYMLFHLQATTSRDDLMSLERIWSHYKRALAEAKASLADGKKERMEVAKAALLDGKLAALTAEELSETEQFVLAEKLQQQFDRAIAVLGANRALPAEEFEVSQLVQNLHHGTTVLKRLDEDGRESTMRWLLAR